MSFKQFIEHIDNPDAAPLTEETLRELADAYPFFTVPDIVALKEGAGSLTDEQRARLRARIALNASDPRMLFRLIDPDGEKFAKFYPADDTPSTPTTDAAIDTFLSTFGRIDPAEEALLERLIFNPVPDYSSVLEAQAADRPSTPADSQDALLDAFLETHAVPTTRKENKVAETPVVTPSADTPLTESLARIYIRQGRYDKAHEIISQLSLNFPKKSSYFADQLRFLQKLMLNRQLIDAKNNKKQ